MHHSLGVPLHLCVLCASCLVLRLLPLCSVLYPDIGGSSDEPPMELPRVGHQLASCSLLISYVLIPRET